MIAAIENAMIARLKAAADAGALGYRWRLLETYPDDWDAYFKNKMPNVAGCSAWSTFGGIEGATDTNDGQLVTGSFGLVVCATNLRNETATRHGRAAGDGEPGSYQLMLDAIGLLADVDLGLDISALKLVEARQVDAAGVASMRNASLWAIRFRTSWTIPTLPFGQGDAVDFSAFHANWDVPPFGGIDAAPATPGIQLPDDAHADATDHLELP